MARLWLWIGTIGTVLYSVAVVVYGILYWEALWFFWLVGMAWLCTGLGLAVLSTICMVMAWRWLGAGQTTWASVASAAPVAVGALVLWRMSLS